MSFELFGYVEKSEAKLTNVKAVSIMIINGVRGVIPGFREVFAHLYLLHGFELGGLLMGQKRCMIHSLMLSILIVLFFLGFGSLLFGVILLSHFFVGLFNFVVDDPFIISAV